MGNVNSESLGCPVRAAGRISKPNQTIEARERIANGGVKYLPLREVRDYLGSERVFGDMSCPNDLKNQFRWTRSDFNIPMRPRYLERMLQPSQSHLAFFCFPTGITMSLMLELWRDRFEDVSGWDVECKNKTNPGIVKTDMGWKWLIASTTPDSKASGVLRAELAVYVHVIYREVTGKNFFLTPEVVCEGPSGRPVLISFSETGMVSIPRRSGAVSAGWVHGVLLLINK